MFHFSPTATKASVKPTQGSVGYCGVPLGEYRTLSASKISIQMAVNMATVATTGLPVSIYPVLESKYKMSQSLIKPVTGFSCDRDLRETAPQNWQPLPVSILHKLFWGEILFSHLLIHLPTLVAQFDAGVTDDKEVASSPLLSLKNWIEHLSILGSRQSICNTLLFAPYLA